jgi:hypothetical protein
MSETVLQARGSVQPMFSLRILFILEKKSMYQWGLNNSHFMRNLQEGTAAAGCGLKQIIPLSGNTKVLNVAAVESCSATWWQPGEGTWISGHARDTVVYIALSAECNELQSSCNYACWRPVTSCGRRKPTVDRCHSYVTYRNGHIRNFSSSLEMNWKNWDRLFWLSFFVLFFSIFCNVVWS